jgi:Bacteriophage Lambda NinG protein
MLVSTALPMDINVVQTNEQYKHFLVTREMLHLGPEITRTSDMKCRYCKATFERALPMQSVCSPDCALAIAKLRREKRERAEIRAAKDQAKKLSTLRSEAQKAFNAYIRARDADKTCVSCGRRHDGQWHAGHYLSVGARPELRFDESNCHRQCQPCNAHLHGNLVLYRAELIKRVGLAEVERLEGPHEPLKLTRDDLRALKAIYRAKTKELFA